MTIPFRYFNISPEVIGLTVLMYVHSALSLRQVEDLLRERGIDICHETVRFWRNRFGRMFAAELTGRRVDHWSWPNWRWRLDEVFVRINGKRAICGVPPITKALSPCRRSGPQFQPVDYHHESAAA